MNPEHSRGDCAFENCQPLRDGPEAMPTLRLSLPETIQERLTSSSYIGLRQLHVDLVDDVVVVTGQVRSHYLKQIAQTIIQGTVGDNNQLRVELAVGEH